MQRRSFMRDGRARKKDHVMNCLSRLGCIVSLSLTLPALGCAGASGTPGASQDSTQSGVVIKSAVISTSTVGAAGSACSDVPTIAASPAADPALLCGPGSIPLPVAADSAGCSSGDVSSITFGCVTATFPTPPALVAECIPIPINDPDMLLPPAVTAALPYIPAAVCPALGLVPPPALPTNGPELGTSTPSAPTTPALPTVWPYIPGPDAGTQPGGALPPGSPPVITCCAPGPVGGEQPDAGKPPATTNG
jgi:hypothetical protein